eukprot:7018490-Ditylum_brightwellii.AAC.1
MQNRAEKCQELCNNANLHEIDYLGCPEINLDTTRQEISSSPIPAKYFYKPGGTMCLTQLCPGPTTQPSLLGPIY